MSLSHLRRSGWIVLLLAAIAFIAWTTSVRIARIAHVNRIGSDPTAANLTGLRHLVVPEHILPSYAWIAETQQMLESGAWRVRHTSVENAPHGREVHAASPYRWWLALMASVAARGSDLPASAAVERGALWADPALLGLFLLLTTPLVARQFGAVSAALVPLFTACVFPLGAGFVPGVPDDFSMTLVLAAWSVLALVVGLAGRASPSPTCASRWMIAGGILGGVGLWVSVGIFVPLLCGIVLGGAFTLVFGRRIGCDLVPAAAWRVWGVAGAATVLCAYLLEYAPGHLGDWELRAVHPLYAVSWLGAAELLALASDRLARTPGSRSRGYWIRLAVAVAALAALPTGMGLGHSLGFLKVDLLAFRLTKQTDGVLAPTFWSWLSRDGLNAKSLATVLPVLLLVPLPWLLRRLEIAPTHRQALVLGFGPLLVALGLAQFHLRWWQTFDAVLLPVLAVAGAALIRAAGARIVRWSVVAAGAAAVVVGTLQLIPFNDLGGRNVLSLPEVEGLVERDLAHTLARRLGPDQAAIVHAPPSVSTTLAYYGNLRTLSSLAWENKAGLSVALRIVISTSREEAHALALSRGVTHLVVPSWDPFFDTYTQSASVQASELFYDSLRRWVVPLWLRPIPYRLPTVGGFESHSVMVFELVDEQEPAIAMSRMTEYFIEMGQLDAARAAGDALRRYPADFSALIARAQLEAALNDGSAFASSFETVLQRLNARADRLLPHDRRVSLAVVLLRGQRPDLARQQVERCLQQLDERRLRFLTTHQQFHLLYLAKVLELEFPLPHLRQLALELIPTESRERL